MEKLIHNPDGTLVSDRPWYLTPGTKVKLPRAWWTSERQFGYITERSAKATVELRKRVKFENNVYFSRQKAGNELCGHANENNFEVVEE